MKLFNTFLAAMIFSFASLMAMAYTSLGDGSVQTMTVFAFMFLIGLVATVVFGFLQAKYE